MDREVHTLLSHSLLPSFCAVGPPGQENLGIFKMLWSIYRNEGVPGLYRGIVPNFLKVIPAVGIGYVAYEQFKMMLHIRT